MRLGINGTVFSRFEVIGRGREISDNNANGKLVFIPTSLSCNKFPSASRKKIIIQFHRKNYRFFFTTDKLLAKLVIENHNRDGSRYRGI